MIAASGSHVYSACLAFCSSGLRRHPLALQAPRRAPPRSRRQLLPLGWGEPPQLLKHVRVFHFLVVLHCGR